MVEKLRLDKYLWAIRVFKTRTLATTAIDAGRVKYNGNTVKPSRIVAIGDKYDIKTPERNWNIEVTALLPTRAGYEVAIKHYLDLTPEADKLPANRMGESFYTGKRLSKTGRPTKKQRRNLEDFMND